MEGTLLVTPEELTTAAGEFSAQATQITSLHQAMLGKVRSLTWEGEAANTYKTKFNALEASMTRINAMIQEHVRENLTISDLAEHFFLHPDYLGRLFKQHAHVSIGHYLTLQKITTAQELLRSGLSVAEAAEYLGFSSYAYFFKTFQKVAGISPSKYRALYSEKLS